MSIRFNTQALPEGEKRKQVFRREMRRRSSHITDQDQDQGVPTATSTSTSGPEAPEAPEGGQPGRPPLPGEKVDPSHSQGNLGWESEQLDDWYVRKPQF